ncbi:MAG: hypothetical protein U5K79_16410 [Cyclobacteriaceae bacterium]|nr:hypothetical protein [Cyclobacteriaceae bacterium]
MFSKIKDDVAKINNYYRKVCHFSSYGGKCSIVYIGIAIVANEFVMIYFGENWYAHHPNSSNYRYFRFIDFIRVPVASVIIAKGRADFRVSIGSINSITIFLFNTCRLNY